MVRETVIEKYLVAQVKALGGEVRKVQWVGRRGAPDRLVMLPRCGRFGQCGTLTSFWVELKAPGEKAKPHHVREHERMRAMGQTVVVIDGLDAVDELLT